MTKQFLQPIDKISLPLMLVLSLVIGLLGWGGKTCGTDCFLRTGPRVRDFSWQSKQVGGEDTAFILTFDRPMDRASVEENLVVASEEENLPLPGKISWAGRRLAYTLASPAPYGTNYQVHLRGAREQFTAQDDPGQVIKPFFGQFSTRDRAFAYIGSQGDEHGRLILYNLSKERKTILTPPNLVVMDFKFYPKGDRILFSAADRGSGMEGIRALKLYTVKTGVNPNSSEPADSVNPANEIELVLDNKDYQNNKFDLSQDGQTIVVQRVNRQNTTDFDLWAIEAGAKPERLNTRGGEFLIAPDSQTLAVAQGEGIGILSLESGAEPLDFLPKFGRILSFSRDGSAAAMVNFNTDNPQLRYTRSLFYVNNKDVQKELLSTNGSIIDCQFNPTATHLYCLLTQLLDGEEYREQPYFAEIDLKTSKVVPLMTLSNYRNIEISMAPDGLGILFDQVIAADTPDTEDPLTTNSGEAIVGGRLWLLIPSPDNSSDPRESQLEELPLVGFRPQWLP
ncbi:MAG: Ig-like domain-containing protein [Xenococcaceae cyanobacterium]